jgi:uncharacterized protein YegL
MKKTVDIAVVLDRSGSMESIKNETINGFNKFVKAQKETGINAKLTLAQFDTEYELVYHQLHIKEVPKMTKKTFVPRGATALLDAIGKTIKSTRKYQKQNDETEYKTIFVIITDGEENASVDYTREDIFKKITKMQKKHQWEFVFLAANQDAISTASHFGISAKKAIRYAADSLGTEDVFESVSKNVMYSLQEKRPISFTDEDRKKQER